MGCFLVAHEEAQKRGRCFERSRAAYSSGDGAAAHTLSEEGKRHGEAMDHYNAQARDFIFRANNASLPADTIDLHGLFVEEAEEVLEKRIAAANGRGEGHLHVIVGKGNHSANHVGKIKPAVETLCRKLGLQFEEGENEGRILIRLRGHGGQGGGGSQPGTQHHQQQGHGRYGKQHQQQQTPHQQQQQQPSELEQLAGKVAPGILKKLVGCCTIT